MAGLSAIRSRHLSLFDNTRKVPATRADCVNGVRPCPYIACRYHLANDDDGSAGVRLNMPMHLAIMDQLENDEPPTFDTCALDVASTGESTVYEIAAAMHIWHSNVEPAIASGLAKGEEAARHLGLDATLLSDGKG